MALIVVLVLLTIAIATMMTFGDGGTTLRFRLRFRRARRRLKPLPAAPGSALTATSPALITALTFGPADAECVLVRQLLTGTLSQRDYQQQMAGLAAADSARGARP
jgi:hypothetical protein